MAADVANFGGHVSVDETNTLEAIWTMRRIAREQLAIHGGWLFGMPGDGIFALFESAVDAVRCALATQARLAEVRVFGGLRLRIGVHLGEVLFQDDLPFGEALIIAARLESLAEPGSVLISAAVMEAVAPRINADFTERGVVSLKHSPRRITVFTVAPSDANEATGTGNVLDWTMLHGRPSAATAIAPAVPPMPVIAIVAEPGSPEEEPPVEPVTEPENLADPVDETASTASPGETDGWAGLPVDPEGGERPADPDDVPPAEEAPQPTLESDETAAVPDQEVGETEAVAPAVRGGLDDTHRRHGSTRAAGTTEVAAPVPLPEAEAVEIGPDLAVEEDVEEPDAGRMALPDDDPTVHLPQATPLVIPDRVSIPAANDERPMEDTGEIDLARAARLLPAACLDELAEALKLHLGPVARVVVDRNARRIVDPHQLLLRLSEEIPAPAERQAFLMKARRSVRRFLG